METRQRKGFAHLSTYYLLYYMAGGTFSFFSMYLRTGPRFDATQIGFLLALGPLVAMVAPYFWGLAADKATHRNTVLLVLIAGTGLSALLLPFSRAFYYVASIYVLFNVFCTSLSSIGDSVTAELCVERGWAFGRIRLWGTIGYAVTTFAVGALLPTDGPWIFIQYAALFLIALLPASRVPKVCGGQSRGARVPYRLLFKNKPLVLLFGLNLIIFLTSSFYYSFFSIYFISDEVGGSAALFGLCNALASLAEFPFMLFADRIVRRFGLSRTMLAGILLLALRWILIGLLPYPPALIAVNMLHGCSYAVVFYCGIVYINEVVNPAFKSSGQAFNGIICFGVTKALASVSGGWLSSIFGFQAIFIAMGILLALLFCVSAVFLRHRKANAAA